MTVLMVESAAEPHAQRQVSPFGMLVLTRAACQSGATRAEIIRDLAPVVAHKVSLGEWRAVAARELTQLLACRLISETRHRISVTASGQSLADTFLGHVWPAPPVWSDQRDLRLVAKSLALTNTSPAALKTLARPDGLRAVVLQSAFGLPLKGGASASRLRAQLAVLALERAFGNKIKSALGQGAGLSAKAGRLLAGQLAHKPRDFGSDGRLIAALAAEQFGAAQADHDTLRLAILRRFVTKLLDDPGPAALGSPSLAKVRSPANDTGPRTRSSQPAEVLARPDLAGFAEEVHAAARLKAQGWPGNRKAFISHVWQSLEKAVPHWRLTEIEFKCMLAEAHRGGLVTLSNADLKDKSALRDIEASAIGYKNTVWHYVRVDDDN